MRECFEGSGEGDHCLRLRLPTALSRGMFSCPMLAREMPSSDVREVSCGATQLRMLSTLRSTELSRSSMRHLCVSERKKLADALDVVDDGAEHGAEDRQLEDEVVDVDHRVPSASVERGGRRRT